VQPECRLVHILYVIGLVKCREDQPQAVNVIGFDLTPVVLFKEASQTLVFEALNHYPSVKRKLTVANRSWTYECSPSRPISA